MMILLWLLLALMGLPLFALLSGVSWSLFQAADIDTVAILLEFYRLTSNPAIVAIPLFTFAGFLLAEGRSPQRLIRLFHAMFGWLPGGLALVTLGVTAFFTAFTGASGVTIVALGGLLFPLLLDEKYSERFSLGLITTSGSLGLLFPPSLPLILYGIIAGVSIEELFRAGVIPGLLLIMILGGYGMWHAWRNRVSRIPFSLREVVSALREAVWEIPLPFILVGSISFGWVTAAEAATITVVWVLLVELVIHREIRPGRFLEVAEESMTLVGSILLILGTALGLTNYLVDAEIPARLLEWAETMISSRWLFLLILNIFLLVVGSLMDIFSAIIVVVPLILPVAERFGVDPLHLGIIFLLNLEIGYSTPPVGLNLFIASLRFDRSILTLYRATIPFLLLMILTLLLVTYFPFFVFTGVPR